MQGASTLGQLGQNQYGQQMGINAAQQQAGAQQQAFNQQGLSNQYQDFLNRQNYPYQQLGFMSDIIRGNTTGSFSTVQNSQVAPSMFSQIAGGLGGLGSLAGAYMSANKAAGGEIKSYAEGGLASLTEPETELAAKSKLPPTTTAEALAKFMLPVINRMHQPAAQPGTTTVAEDMAREILSRGQPQQPQEPQQLEEPQEPQGQEPQQGMPPPEGMADGGIASLPVQNFNPDNYAGGGIIAFAEGDQVKGADDDMVKRIIQAESGGRHLDAKGNLLTSSAGAEGITQAMPKTQASPGFGLFRKVSKTINLILTKFILQTKCFSICFKLSKTRLACNGNLIFTGFYYPLNFVINKFITRGIFPGSSYCWR